MSSARCADPGHDPLLDPSLNLLLLGGVQDLVVEALVADCVQTILRGARHPTGRGFGIDEGIGPGVEDEGEYLQAGSLGVGFGERFLGPWYHPAETAWLTSVSVE